MLGTFELYLAPRPDEEPAAGNATLLAEICPRGYRGSLRTLREHLGPRRQVGMSPPPPPVPSAR